jgi:nucleoside-diphosphate-sugar epimerase
MSGLTVVLGYGAVGRAVCGVLLARGWPVRVAQRTRPADLPAGAEFRACDALKPEDVAIAVEGAAQVVVAFGFPYDRKVWRTAWPTAMANVVEACARSGARIVFLDNLYQLGPQTAPRTEDMPLTHRGAKPAILAEVTAIWQAAARAGRIRLAALRAPDFYGPGVGVSHLGDSAFGALARGKAAMLLAPPDTPHDFAYVPDIARAIALLLEAPDETFNQVWNMPCAPTLTPREILRLGAVAIGARPVVHAIPLALLPALGLFVPFLREVADVGFTWDRPYIVDGSKFTRRFGFTPTPFEAGAPATARSFEPTASSPGIATPRHPAAVAL